MTKFLVIQNTKNEGIGVLGELLRKDEIDINTVLAKSEEIPDINPDAIIILGAPESANDDLPYLKKELEIIRQSVEKNIPLLGICLGSQLIAKAFGGKVFKGPIKEIGFYNDIEFDNFEKSRLFHGMSNPTTVFHWHGDTFDLPENAIRLAHSKNYQNQAIKIGSAVGIQFHLEVDEPTVRLWLEKSRKEIEETSDIESGLIERQISQHIQTVRNNLEIFYKNFKSEFKL